MVSAGLGLGLPEGGVVLPHEVPHDPGPRQLLVIKGELVAVVTSAEHQLGAVTVVTRERE